MLLALPARTDIRGPLSTTGADYVSPLSERGSRWWRVLFVDDVSKGFTLEFRIAVLKQFRQPTPLS